MTTTSHEHHTHGDPPRNPAQGRSRATSRDGLSTPGEGLRRGEALALRWDGLDLDDGSLRVRARCRASAGVAQQRDAADRLAEVLGWS